MRRKKLVKGSISIIALFILLLGIYQYFRFTSLGITEYAVFNEQNNLISGTVSSNRLKTDKKVSSNCILSNIYQISNKDNDDAQIRFRYLYSNPLYNENLMENTDYKVFTESGEDITEKVLRVSSYSFMGCQGTSVTLIFGDDTYLPNQGDEFKVMISTFKTDNKELEVNPIAYMSYEFSL